MADSKTAEEGESRIDSHIVTSVSLTSYRFKWTVKDIAYLPDVVTSPDICPLPSYLWNVSLQIAKRLVISLNKILGPDCYVSLSYSASDSKGEEFISENEKELNFSRTVETIKIYDGSVDNIPSDELILDFHFELAHIVNNPHKPDPMEKYDGQQKLLEDMAGALNDAQTADVALYVDGGHVRAHRCILCIRSQVFKKIFQHQMEEDDRKEVQIEELKLPVLQKLVDFLSSGVVDAVKDLNDACELYFAADKYEVFDLREMVGQTLLSLLTPESATKVLILADHHGDQILKKKLIEFIRSHLNSVLDTDTWPQFVRSKTELAAEVVVFCSKIV